MCKTFQLRTNLRKVMRCLSIYYFDVVEDLKLTSERALCNITS